MASPRSMWSGSISLGLVTIPVTIAKSWSDEREQSLRDLCAVHEVPVDRTERCPTGKSCGLSAGKIKGVEVGEGKWRTISQNEMLAIEEASASDALEIVDYQPVYDLPMEFGTGTYYVRYNPPKKGSKLGLDVLATFVQALAQQDHAAVVWWKRATNWKLCALHVAPTGELLLTQLPLANEWRKPDRMERAHVGVPTDKGAVAMFQQLLAQIGSEEFDLSRYKNEALALRQAAVEKILAEEGKENDGEQKGEQEEKQEQKGDGDKVPDLMRQLQESMKQFKKTEGEKV